VAVASLVTAVSTLHLAAFLSFPASLPAAAALDGQPIQVQIQEQEPGAFLVQWRVPKIIPFEAMPTLALPEGCRAEGERTLIDQPGGWLNRQLYRCSEELAGRTIRILYPLYNASLTTLVRVDFLSGERFAHVLNPSEDSWRVPEAGAGELAWLRGARRAVVEGASHVFGHWVHVLFLIAICMLGRGSWVRLITAFAAGQLAAVALVAGLGIAPDPGVAEICMAIAVAVLAAQALRPPEARRQLGALAAIAGLFHGFGVAVTHARPEGVVGPEWLYLAFVVLGMDTALLALAFGVSTAGDLVARRWPSVPRRRALAYAVGGASVAVALSIGLGGTPAAEAETSTTPRLPGTAAASSGASVPGSRRLAPRAPDVPIQSFLAVEPYEVRHQVLVRLAEAVEPLGMADLPMPETEETGGDRFVEVEAQAAVGERVAAFVVENTTIAIDGEMVAPIVDRFAFMTVGRSGVLPRAVPERERLDEALVGVTIVYPVPGMPGEVTLQWETFAVATGIIAATVTDPETSASSELSTEAPALRWENLLTEDPIPTVAGIDVEPPTVPLPLASLALLAATLFLLVIALLGRRPKTSLTLSRVTLALAVVAVPIAGVTMPLPSAIRSVPTGGQARRILAGVRPNVYRAFELRDEAAAYDCLAVSVTGPTLTEVYLEHRRALELEERGGARARVEAVEILEVRDVEPAADGGFTAEAGWKVGGNVTHFGHRHFRQNRYDALVHLVPDEGVWKVRSIEILEEERLR
jgi:hypothetical protein